MPSCYRERNQEKAGKNYTLFWETAGIYEDCQIYEVLSIIMWHSLIFYLYNLFVQLYNSWQDSNLECHQVSLQQESSLFVLCRCDFHIRSDENTGVVYKGEWDTSLN